MPKLEFFSYFLYLCLFFLPPFQSHTAKVQYLPIGIAPVTNQLFVLPHHSTHFPLLPSDLEILQIKQAGGSVSQVLGKLEIQ